MILAVFKHFWDNKTVKKEKNIRNEATNGNAMIYVLIAIALFGVLTATLSSQNNQADNQDIDDEMVEFYANELIEYAAAAKNVVDQMLMTGSTIDSLDFVNPASAAFDTPPHINKVFHPQGGGLNYKKTFSTNIENNLGLTPGWFFQQNANVEWTESTANDVIISALRIKSSVCKEINKRITGSTTIPQLGTGMNAIFEDGTADLSIANCAGCEGYQTLCVLNSAGDNWGFYSIIAAR